MNHGMVAYLTGRILMVVGALMSLTLLVSFYYQEPGHYQGAIALAVALTISAGMSISLKKPANQRLYVREGLVITSLCWILLAVSGALPFFISGAIPSFVDAFFESTSGFTTTGSSILTNVEALPHSLLFWRSATHFVGGMGVLVFALAILPEVTGQSVHLMRAEVPGPSFGKLVSRLRETAQILYLIYAGLTVVLGVVLYFCGMSPFDALLHAMATAGTGGFSTKGASIAAFHSPLIEYVLAVGMLIFGVNFNLYFFVLRGHFKDALKSEELRIYIGIVLLATFLLTVSIAGHYSNISDGIRDAFFTVATIMTTTGFGTVDFTKWPLFSQLIILLLMFTGACAGSTAGGLKVGRLIRMAKIARAHFQRTINPRRITPVRAEGKILDEREQNEVGVYLMVYVAVFFIILIVISLDQVDFLSAFSAVAGTFNNIGPGLGSLGPTANFSELSDVSKLALSFGMLAGRLELFPVLILFSSLTWRMK